MLILHLICLNIRMTLELNMRLMCTTILLRTKAKILLLNQKECFQVEFLLSSRVMKTYGVFLQHLIPHLIMKLMSQYKLLKVYFKIFDQSYFKEELIHWEDLQEHLKLWMQMETIVFLLMRLLMDWLNMEFHLLESKHNKYWQNLIKMEMDKFTLMSF